MRLAPHERDRLGLTHRLLVLDRRRDLLELLDAGAGVGLLLGDGQLTAAAADRTCWPRTAAWRSWPEPDQVDQVQEQPGQPGEVAAELQRPTLATAEYRDTVAIDPLSKYLNGARVPVRPRPARP
jgi:hypothetical protein